MNWSEITIDKYIQLYQLEKDELEDIDLLIKRIAIIYELTEQEVENISITRYNEMQGELSFLLEEPSQTKLREVIEFDGIKYYLNKSLKEMKLGEWMDLESIQKDDVLSNIHKVMGILYKKDLNANYCPKTADELSALFFMKMDIETALAAFFFFYLYGCNYIQITKDCSLLEQMIQGLNQMKNQQEGQLAEVRQSN